MAVGNIDGKLRSQFLPFKLGFFGSVPKATGRLGYAPADLLKLYICGYLNRVRSSRWLEAEIHGNIEVIWLLRHLNRY
jgi:transposase